MAAYNISIANIAERMERSLALVDPAVDEVARQRGVHVKARELLLAYESTLQALLQHFEDCVSILMSLTPSAQDSTKNSHVKKFQKQIYPLRSRTGLVAGRLRHQQRRLRMLAMDCGDILLGGYFIEAGLKSGAVGPDPEVHKGGLTAFSFNRDLRLHICNLLFTSDCLRTAIDGLARHSATPGPPISGEHRLAAVVTAVASLPEAYFPDEYSYARPLLDLEPATSPAALVVHLGRFTSIGALAGRRCNVTVNVFGDGATNSWTLPYSPGSRYGLPHQAADVMGHPRRRRP